MPRRTAGDLVRLAFGVGLSDVELSNSERSELESKLGRSLFGVASQHHRELVRLAGDPPDVSRVPESFWARVEDETRQAIAEVILLAWMASAVRHGLSGDTLQQPAREFAERRALDTARKYVEHSRRRLDGLAPGQATRDRIDTTFSHDRSAMVAETEVTAAQTAGGEAWAEDARRRGLVIKAVWRHSSRRPRGHSHAAKEPCPICSPLEGTTEEVWRRIAPTGAPAHPHCDCFIAYEEVPTGITQLPIGA